MASRILSSGKPFGETGIIVRNSDLYVPPLRAALERFGIAARFYFPDTLAEHGTVRFLSGVIEALRSGWEHSTTLAAIRFAGGSPAFDRFDFYVRERLPGKG